MNNFSITFLSLLGLSIVLFLIFYFKNLKLHTKLSEGFIFSFLYAATLSILVDFLPNSMHVIKFISLSSISLIIGTILIQIEKNRTDLIASAFYLISHGLITFLSSTTFYTHHLKGWTLILSLVIFITTYTLLSIFTKKQGLFFYISLIPPTAISSIFIYSSVANIIFYKSISSILLTTGTLIIHALIIFFSLNKTNHNFKHAKIINFTLLLSATILIFTSNILLFI